MFFIHLFINHFIKLFINQYLIKYLKFIVIFSLYKLDIKNLTVLFIQFFNFFIQINF